MTLPINRYRTILLLSYSALAVIMILVLVFPNDVQHAPELLSNCVLAFVVLSVTVVVSGRIGNPWKILLRIACIVWLVSFLFDAVSGLQQLLYSNWNDDSLIRFERIFTGIETSLLLEKITNPVLTEWLMASYVIYVPLLPFTAWLAFRAGGEEAVYSYLLSLLAVNILCNAGFILYPVASQMYHNPDQYSIPLTGWTFTRMSEWMRINVHYPGGSFPSPHNAGGAVMLFTLWKWNRGWARILTPFLLSIPLATVYGRFHYLSDGIAGILLALTVLRIVNGRESAAVRQIREFRPTLNIT